MTTVGGLGLGDIEHIITVDGQRVRRDAKIAVAGTGRHCVIYDLNTLKESRGLLNKEIVTGKNPVLTGKHAKIKYK